MKALRICFFAALFASSLTSCVLDEQPRPEAPAPQLEEHAASLKDEGGPTAQAYCGDNLCNGNERPETCPSDCSICGDGLCYAHESLYCPEDCCYSTPEACGG